MSELKELKKENKKLKKLLKNAVELLHKSKELMQLREQPAKPKTKKKAAAKRSIKAA